MENFIFCAMTLELNERTWENYIEDLRIEWTKYLSIVSKSFSFCTPFFVLKTLAVTNLQSLNVEQSNKNILLENIFIISIYKKSCINEIIFKRLSGCQWEYTWRNIWNSTYPAGIYLFKVNNKDTKTRSTTSFWCLYC